jgi:peptidoglycan hydrolase CwlO-like protein
MRYVCRTIAIALFFLCIAPRVSAQQVCEQQDPCAGKSSQDKVSCYESVVTVCGKTRETLFSQINYMNNQIQLTTLRIESVRTVITKLSSEIDNLENEIQRLELLLTRRTELILKRIPESYKRASLSQFGLLFFSRDFPDFLTRIKYIDTVQKQDAAALLQLKAIQTNFGERKTVREDKKQQQEKAKRELETQTQQLVSQKREKDILLSQTQNNEAKYKQLLENARTQVTAFQNFVTNLGGASILSNQTVCNDWGCYYNQRDSQWGRMSLGRSSLSVAEFGCLVSSMAMVATHYGKSIKPSDIAGTADAFFTPDSHTAYLWKAITVNGVGMSRVGVGLDSEVSQGRPVVVGIGYGPSHFIVIKSGSNGNYIMNDPFVEGGHDISFTSKYSLGSISTVEKVIFN